MGACKPLRLVSREGIEPSTRGLKVPIVPVDQPRLLVETSLPTIVSATNPHMWADLAGLTLAASPPQARAADKASDTLWGPRCCQVAVRRGKGFVHLILNPNVRQYSTEMPINKPFMPVAYSPGTGQPPGYDCVSVNESRRTREPRDAAINEGRTMDKQPPTQTVKRRRKARLSKPNPTKSSRGPPVLDRLSSDDLEDQNMLIPEIRSPIPFWVLREGRKVEV